MRSWLFGVGLGLLALMLPALPATGGAFQLGTAAAGCLLLCVRRAWLLSGLLLGFAWGSHNVLIWLDARLSECVIGTDRQLVVSVLGDPQPLGRPGSTAVRFRAKVLGDLTAGTAADGDEPCAVPTDSELRLAWYRSPAVERGQRWTVTARVKPPWGYQNPGGFDFERWLFSRKLQGTGYVVLGELLEPAPQTWFGGYRVRLRCALLADHLRAGAILYALISGDGGALSAEQWQRFRNTGTVHLMVVSGLHVGLVAGLGYLLGNWSARLLPWLLLWLPARRAGILVGMLLAPCYVLFTGSGVPGLRALCMLAAASLAAWWGRRVWVWDLLLIAIVLLLLLDPLAVHQQGFWLSFGAVLTLVGLHAGRHQPHAAWRQLGSSQLALLIGLTPLLVGLHGQVAAVGVVANLLAVPLMSLVVIPLALLSAVLLVPLPEPAGLGLHLADQVLGLLLRLLDALAGITPLTIGARPELVAAAIAAAGLLLRGVEWRARIVLWLLWSCWCLPRVSALREGEFRVTALDVGQGSAILVDTASHRLLFDAGPSYPSGFDLGAAVVVPSVAATGPRHLDAMVLSHADIDHRGGARSVLEALPATVVFESVADSGSRVCSAGDRWIWDGVTFEFLSPPAGPRHGGDNDGSCVLEVASADARVWLPGDISTLVEGRLLRRARPVQLLFAPHHGSNSSSSRAFVRILRPAVVFVSAGKNNRYGHPHARVVNRYRSVGADLHVTGQEGALIWESSAPLSVQRYRLDRGAYWTSGG